VRAGEGAVLEPDSGQHQVACGGSAQRDDLGSCRFLGAEFVR
jgi:hypothetical protein